MPVTLDDRDVLTPYDECATMGRNGWIQPLSKLGEQLRIGDLYICYHVCGHCTLRFLGFVRTMLPGCGRMRPLSRALVNPYTVANNLIISPDRRFYKYGHEVSTAR